jgi:Spy/CpxP family protein refolding chaperone
MMERREKLVKELGLTDEQKEKMDRFREEKKEEKKELHQALRGKQKELREELQLYDSNMGKVKSLASEIKRLQGKLIDLRVESIENVKSVLTEEQYKKFIAKTKKFRNKMKNKHHRR